MANANYSIGNKSSTSKTFSLTISASDINSWASANIPSNAKIGSVNLSFSAKKSALSNRGSITIKVGGTQIFSASKVVDSTGWYDVNISLKSYVQSETNSGQISGDIYIYIDGPLRNVDWSVNDIKITYDYTPKHICRFYNWDGTHIRSHYCLEGETTGYSSETPTRPSDEQYDYVFSGWSPPFAPIYEETIYTAVYTAIPRKINKILIDTAKPKKILIDNQEVKAIFVDTTKVYG